MRKDQKPAASFSEPEAQRILSRAAELEVTLGNRFTTDDLRQIAAQAGIEPHALQHAIDETRAVDAQRDSGDGATGVKAGDIAMLAGAGALLGIVAIGTDNMHLLGSSAIPVFAPSALFTIYRALRHPLRSGFSGLLRDLGIVFGSFTAAIAAVEGFASASAAMTWSLMAGALACGILSLRGARPQSPISEIAASDSR
jgi:hypothetical protein